MFLNCRTYDMASSTLVSTGLAIIVVINMIASVDLSPTLSNRRKSWRKKIGTVPNPKASRVPAFDHDLRLHKAMLEGSKAVPKLKAENLQKTDSVIPHSVEAEGSLETNEIKTNTTSGPPDDRTPTHLLYQPINKSVPTCPQDSNSNGNHKAVIQADPLDCSQYFYCVWGKPVVYSCPWLTLWDDSKKTCNWYYNVDCKN